LGRIRADDEVRQVEEPERDRGPQRGRGLGATEKVKGYRQDVKRAL
jgi:hypothetical protein